MAATARFEIVLPADRRAELAALAAEAGTSASSLARLAIIRMLNDPASLTGRKEREAQAAAATKLIDPAPYLNAANG
jgi:hypothetical protein